jgi:hypothetical protein
MTQVINPLNTKLNPICHLLALLGAHPILHISRIRVNYVIGTKYINKNDTSLLILLVADYKEYE